MEARASRVLKSSAVILAASAAPHVTFAADGVHRDAFFWLGEINKASAVINTDEGLLDKSLAPRLPEVSRPCWPTATSLAGKRPRPSSPSSR
ncbi:hypothetical protein ACTMU2_04605 [Cupriavidus basilensis]